MTVITISRLYGSGGEEISNYVCQVLGYRKFDKRQIARAAVEAGLSEHEIIDYTDFSEENYKIKKFLDFLLHRSRPPTLKHIGLEEKVSTLVAEEQAFSEASALALVQKAISAAYRAGDFVILGRGGQIILKDCPDVIHVRIEAELEDRIRRVESHLRETPQGRQAEIALRRAAQDLIAERDTSSTDYIRQFYNADWADLSLYHLILNTSKLTIHQAAQIIVDTTLCLSK